jgi:hypothetical protein
MRWVRSGGSREEMYFTSDDPDYKKLVSTDGLIHYIDRDKVSAIYERKWIRNEGETEDTRPPFTVFVVDGVQINVNVHIDNAHTWLTSWKDA